MLKIYGRNVVKETVYAGKRKIFNLYLDESHKNTEKKFIEFCIGLLIGTIVILFYVIFKSDIKIYLKFIFCILGITTIKFLG